MGVNPGIRTEPLIRIMVDADDSTSGSAFFRK